MQKSLLHISPQPTTPADYQPQQTNPNRNTPTAPLRPLHLHRVGQAPLRRGHREAPRTLLLPLEVLGGARAPQAARALFWWKKLRVWFFPMVFVMIFLRFVVMLSCPVFSQGFFNDEFCWLMGFSSYPKICILSQPLSYKINRYI